MESSAVGLHLRRHWFWGVSLWSQRRAVFHLFHKVLKTAALTRGAVYGFSTVSMWATLCACQFGVRRLIGVWGGMLWYEWEVVCHLWSLCLMRSTLHGLLCVEISW